VDAVCDLLNDGRVMDDVNVDVLVTLLVALWSVVLRVHDAVLLEDELLEALRVRLATERESVADVVRLVDPRERERL
jgi:hypothetical protein